MKCACCGEETDGKLELIMPSGRLTVCTTCLNLYANEEFAELEKRMNHHGIKTIGEE